MKTMPLIEITNFTEEQFNEHYALTRKPKGLFYISVYKDHNIWSLDGLIAVNKIEDDKEYLFIIGLDDSKSSGKRKFIKSANTVKTAKEYIDWKTQQITM